MQMFQHQNIAELAALATLAPAVHEVQPQDRTNFAVARLSQRELDEFIAKIRDTGKN